MTVATNKRNKVVKELLNGTSASIKSVIPIEHKLNQPALLGKSINIKFGILIGITGDVSGKLILSGELPIFSTIGESMFGMPVEGEMLRSFSSELGNMIAGNLSTIIEGKGIVIDITYPSVIEGNTKITGYKEALKITSIFSEVGEMDVYLLID